MDYIILYLKNKGILVFLIVLLLFWAISSTILNLRLKPEVLLIGVDEQGTRIISSNRDKILKIETVNFLRNFILHLYNFDHISFRKNQGVASDLMSEDYWAKTKQDIINLEKRVVKENISQSSVIKKMSKISDNHYQVLIHVNQLRRLKSSKSIYKIDVFLQRANRLKSNVWGFEVTKVEEKLLNKGV